MIIFEQSLTARGEDIDELDHVNNAVWVRWIELVATAHWHASADPAHVDRYAWMINRHEIDYLRGLRLNETVIARTWIADPPKGARCDRHMEFVDRAGSVHVRSKTTWVLVDRTTQRPLRVPVAVIAPFLVADIT
jgi:acyl-CoA thioester hydrolase